MNLMSYVLILFLGLLLTQEIFRRFPRFTLAVFTIIPMLAVPYWIENDIILDWFNWSKVFSIFFALIWFSVFRLTSLGEKKIAKIGIYVFLVFNMLEAVTIDILSTGMTHYLNATAGILLIITLNKIDSIGTSKDEFLDVNWNGMTMMWIIGYTIWNWTFVYLNFINVAALHLAVLGAPLFIAFINRGRWLQVRALTLGTFLLTYFLLFTKLGSDVYSGSWKNENFSYTIASASFLFAFAYIIIFLQSKRACG